MHAYPYWTILAKKRRGLLRRERVLLAPQSSALEVGLWLEEQRRESMRSRSGEDFIIMEHPAEGIEPLACTDTSGFLELARAVLREEHAARRAALRRLARNHD